MDGWNDSRYGSLDASTFRSTGWAPPSTGWLVAAGPDSRWIGIVGIGPDDSNVRLDRNYGVDSRYAYRYPCLLDSESKIEAVMKMGRNNWSSKKSKDEVFVRLVQEIEKSNLRQENVKSETGINHARMLLSKSCVYGLRAALFLSAGEQGQYIPIRNMSEKLDISFHFLTKILQQLTADGLLESYKGPNGGVRLTRGSDEVSLLDIVRAIDGDAMFKECALGLPGCGHMTPCPMHDKWTVTREQIREMLEKTTLKELSSRGKEFNLRINATGGFEGFA